MALIGTDQNDDQNKIVQPTSSSSPNAHAGSGGGFVGGSGSGSGQGVTANANASNTQAGGGGYANLSQYLQANQGSGATTGQAAENVVQQSGNQAMQAQNAYNTDATNDIATASAGLGQNQDTINQIKSGTVNQDQTVLNNINKGAYNYTSDPSIMNDLGHANSDTLKNIVQAGNELTGQSAYVGPTDFSKYTYTGPQYNDIAVNYGGPSSINSFTGRTAQDQMNAISQNQAVQGNVQNAQGGQAGVSALLRNAYQQPTYTAGENSLDAFLAGGTTGGQQALSQAAGVGQNVSNNYSNINNLLSGQITNAQNTAKDTNAAYQTAVNNAINTSNATQAAYGGAESGAKDKGIAAQTALKNDAIRAQGELNARAAQKAALDEAAKANNNNKNPNNSSNTLYSYNNSGPVAGAAERGVNSFKEDLGNLAATTKQAGGAVSDVYHGVKGALGFAHGGKVPNYSKLLKALGRK